MTDIIWMFLKIQKRNLFVICIQYIIGVFCLLIGLSFLRYSDMVSTIVYQILGNKREWLQVELPVQLDAKNQMSWDDIEAAGILIFGREKMQLYETNSDYNVMVLNPNWKQLDAYRELFNLYGSDDVDESRVIPALVGDGYDDTFVEGNNYRFQYADGVEIKELDIKVIKKLDKKDYFFGGNASWITETIRYDRDFLLIPQFEGYLFNYESLKYNMLIPLNKERGEKIELLNDKISPGDDNIGLISIEEQLKQIYERNRPMIAISLIFSGVLIGLSTIGCMGVMLVSISNRKKEFALLISLGLNKSHLLYLLIVQGMLVSLIGSLIGALLFGGFSIIVSQPFFGTGVTECTKVFLIILVTGFIGEIIPIKSVIGMDVAKTIKER